MCVGYQRQCRKRVHQQVNEGYHLLAMHQCRFSSSVFRSSNFWWKTSARKWNGPSTSPFVAHAWKNWRPLSSANCWPSATVTEPGRSAKSILFAMTTPVMAESVRECLYCSYHEASLLKLCRQTVGPP